MHQDTQTINKLLAMNNMQFKTVRSSSFCLLHLASFSATHLLTFTCTFTLTFTHTFKHTHIYTQIYTHTHINTCVPCPCAALRCFQIDDGRKQALVGDLVAAHSATHSSSGMTTEKMLATEVFEVPFE